MVDCDCSFHKQEGAIRCPWTCVLTIDEIVCGMEEWKGSEESFKVSADPLKLGNGAAARRRFLNFINATTSKRPDFSHTHKTSFTPTPSFAA